jgi:hypothetical protein
VSLTYFGVIIAIAGLILLLRNDIMAMLAMMMVCALFGGSAALALPALGGASVPPVQFALLFGVARILLPGSGLLPAAGRAFRANLFLGLYALYGVVSAMIAPRLFAGMILVVPLRFTGRLRSLFDTVPLAFSSSNITVPVYMTGSFLAGVVGYVAMDGRRAPTRFVKTAVVIVWIHIFLGLSAAILKGTPYDTLISFVRNANYLQTDQTIEGFARIKGVFPEPSSYAAFAFGWFVFVFECWFRNILPRRTGPAAAMMGIVLFLSTSSTAYVALGGYALLFGLRILYLPRSLEIRKGMALVAAILIIILLVSALFFLFPAAAEFVWDMLQHLTVGKQQSESGLQRAFWARLGLQAFQMSYGLGIGAGSFRSSSFVTAMLGSVGAVGSLFFILHVINAWKPLRRSTYAGARSVRHYGEPAMIGAAAGWAALGVLIPAAIIAPSSDPGNDFAVFAGIALALRVRRPTDSARNAAVASGASDPHSGELGHDIIAPSPSFEGTRP